MGSKMLPSSPLLMEMAERLFVETVNSSLTLRMYVIGSNVCVNVWLDEGQTDQSDFTCVVSMEMPLSVLTITHLCSDLGHVEEEIRALKEVANASRV